MNSLCSSDFAGMKHATPQVQRLSKTLLFVFWFPQDIIIFVILVLESRDLHLEIRNGFGSLYLLNGPVAYIAIANTPITLVLAAVSLFLNVIEPILFMKHKLSPTLYFIFQLIKSILWTPVAISTTYVLVNYLKVTSSAFVLVRSLITSIIMLTSVLASLSYASIMFHRRKRQGEPKMKSWRKQELENTEKEADAAPVELEHREPMIPELENSAALSELPTYDHSIQELSTGYPWLELGDD